MYLRNNGVLVTEEEKQDGDIKLSELSTDILYLNDENKFSTTFPSDHRYTSISKDDFDMVYYLSSDILCVRDYIEYDVNETYYKYNERDYYYTENQAPNEIAGNCTIVDTQAPVYTTVDTIYSYVKDGSMAYSFDAQTANYVEGTTASASSTTTIKDYFKNLTAPDVEIGLKNVQLLEVLNKTDLVNIDRQYKLNKDGSVKLDKNGNPIVQTGKQTIKGSFLNDVITGGQGKDTINLATGNDIVNAGKDNDTINIKGAGIKTITIANDDGNDTITGTSVPGSGTLLNFTDIDVDSVSDAKNNLEYIRSKNNLVIKRTYTVGDETKTSTTTIKDYFKSSTLTPNVYLNDINTPVSLYSVLSGFDAGTKGTHLNDTLTGTKKADKITTGRGTDTITGGKGNDKITIDGNGSKYIVMNTGDGTDTVTSKVNDYIYLQFKGAGITNDSTAKANLTYEKSGKNDIKITSTVEASAIIAPTGYISNTGIDTDKISYYYSCASGSYYTKITEDTGLYSYETDGETRYTTEKNETVKLNTAKLVQNRNRYTEVVDSAGFLTTSTNYSASTDDYIVTDLSSEGITNLYAYKSKTYTGIYEYVYSTNNNVAIKYSDLWLKKPYSDSSYYVFTTEKENDDCIQVSSLDKIYHWYDSVKLESTSDTYEEITNDKFDSIYYIDKNHTYIADIDNNNTTPIYKEFDISSSYYLELPDPHYYSTDRGMAVTGALTENSYKKIDNIYKTTDDEGKVVLSLDKPENFKEDISSTSVIIKDYLTKSQSVIITNSDNTSSARWVSNILYDIGLNIGNANSKKAQTLTGSKLNDNIYGGSGKDKITTGTSNSYGRGDIINPGKGNDTITIDGNGNKTVNIANADGNDTIIFTDNNKKTAYDYTTNKMLYLNFDNNATLSYDMKGKDLVINRSYVDGTKTAAATTTLKDYFNVDYKEDIVKNIYINGTQFNASNYFNNSTIDKSSGKKAQKINGNMFDNTIIGGSANDTINGCGGSDTLDGKNGSDTYVVNYKSGSKHYLGDRIVISDTGTGAKDVDTLKLDVKKKDMALLFNINRITDEEAYSENDIIVGEKHYSYDNQLMVFADIEQLDEGVGNNAGKFTSAYGIIADGIEKIVTSDKKTISLNNIKEIAQDVASWLSATSYDSSAAVLDSSVSNDILTLFAKYNPDNAVIKEYMS